MCLRTAETAAGDLVNFSPGEQTLFLTAVENHTRPFSRSVSIYLYRVVCGPGWRGGGKETMRKGKGPGKGPGRATEMERRDVSGFVREENLGCLYHVDIFVGTQDSARTPLPCLGKVGPLSSSAKHRQAGRQATCL